MLPAVSSPVNSGNSPPARVSISWMKKPAERSRCAPSNGGHVMTITAQKVNAAALSKQTAKVQQLTCAIGAEVNNLDLGTASRDPALMEEIRRLLLQHKVLFFRDQEITRAEHVAFASYFGELED